MPINICGDRDVYIYDLSPGQAQSPYHYEYNEEWLLVLEGSIILRDTDGGQTLNRATSSASGPAPPARTRS
jgi:uncharacterized cupin superfamily protein